MDSQQLIAIALDTDQVIKFSLLQNEILYANLGQPTAVVDGNQIAVTQDHSLLYNLDKDDHPQYLNELRATTIFLTRKELLCGALNKLYYTKQEVLDLIGQIATISTGSGSGATTSFQRYTLQMIANSTVVAGTAIDVLSPTGFTVIENDLTSAIAAFGVSSNATTFRKNVQVYVNGQLMLMENFADSSPASYDYNRGTNTSSATASKLYFAFNIQANSVITILANN